MTTWLTISDVVDQLDLSDITGRYEGERRGGPPYHPRMMVKVLLYGYCVGVSSSRRIAQRLHEDIAFRLLAATIHRTSAPSATFARIIWMRCRVCSCRYWRCASRRGW